MNYIHHVHLPGEDMTRERLAEIDPEIIVADGFDDAILGIGERNGHPAVAIYDRDTCLRILIKRDGMTYNQAEEFFDFNVACAWVGERTPIFVRK